MRTLDVQPATDAGRRFVEIAESHIDDLAARAAAHDRDAAFPTDNFDDLHRSGDLQSLVTSLLRMEGRSRAATPSRGGDA